MLINDEKKIQEIAKWSEQEFIKQAKYVALFITMPKKTKNAYGERGREYCKQQAGAAIQNFLLKLTELELSTCWIGHFNEERIKHLLKIQEEGIIEAIFPIGIANEKPKKRMLRDLGDFIYFNEWEKSRMKRIEKIEARLPEGYGWKIANDL